MKKSSQPMTNCPECGVQVREDRLTRHIRKVHNTTPGVLARRQARSFEVNPRPKTRGPARFGRDHHHDILGGEARYNLEAVKVSRLYWLDVHGVVHFHTRPAKASPGPTDSNHHDISPPDIKQRTVKWVVCPECQRTIKKDMLKKHIAKVHTENK